MPLAPSPAPATLRFRSARTFETWLRKNHSTSDGVWLEIAKPGTPEPTIGYVEAVEVALCYGWIDGQKKAQDAMYWLQRFTPRRPRSIWSKVNRARAQALIAAGPAVHDGPSPHRDEHSLEMQLPFPVSYTHLTLPTIYSV